MSPVNGFVYAVFGPETNWSGKLIPAAARFGFPAASARAQSAAIGSHGSTEVTVVVPIVGKLSDLYGRKPFLLVGVTIFIAGSMLCGAATSMTWLVAARGFQGIGAGFSQATAFTTIAEHCNDDVTRLRRILPANHDQIAVTDVGFDHEEVKQQAEAHICIRPRCTAAAPCSGTVLSRATPLRAPTPASA